MANRFDQNQQEPADWGYWIITIILLVSFWPVGLFLLLRKLKDDKRDRRTYTAAPAAEAAPAAKPAEEAAAAPAAEAAGEEAGKKTAAV